MNNRIIQLQEWGCDAQSIFEMLGNDEAFYFDCLKELHNDVLFGQLNSAIESKSATDAFKISHTLKGVLANYGITPMLNKTKEIVELMRGGQFDESVIHKMQELTQMNDRLGEIIGL